MSICNLSAYFLAKTEGKNTGKLSFKNSTSNNMHTQHSIKIQNGNL